MRVAEVARRNGTLDPRDQAALAQLARGVPPDPATLAALGRHLAAMGARRPVVIVVDGADGDRGGLAALVQWALEHRRTAPTPVLFVWVAEPGDPSRGWLGRGGVDRVAVGPLSSRVVRAVLRTWCALDETGLVRIARRAAGHLAVARRLLVDVLHRGTHRPVPVEPAMGRRIAAACLDDGDGLALELAATFGELVPVDRWRRQAAEIDAVRDDAWLGRMAAAGLVERLARRSADLPEGLRFVTPMVRQALLERARAAGRLRSLYQLAVASWLEEPPRGRWTWGDQLAGAGLDELAIDAWLAAAVARSDRGDPAGAAVLAERASALSERVGSSRTRQARHRARYDVERGAIDPRGAPLGPVERAFFAGRARLRTGDLDGAVQAFASIADRAHAYAGLGLAWAARVEGWRGRPDAVARWLDAVGARDRYAIVRWEIAAVRAERERAAGRREQATAQLAGLVGQLVESGGVDAVRAQLQLAVLYVLAERYAEAEPLVRRASIEAVRRHDPGHRRFACVAGALVALGIEDGSWLEVELERLSGAQEVAGPEVLATYALLGERMGAAGHTADSVRIGVEVAAWRGAITALRWWDPPSRT